MVAVRRVDHAIGGFCFGDQQVAVVQGPDHGFHAQLLQFGGLIGASDQSTHLMAVAREVRRNRTADKTACTRHKYLHVRSPLIGDESMHGSIARFYSRKNGVSLKSILTLNQ